MKKPVKILITGDTHLGGGRVVNLALENAAEQLFGDFLKQIWAADIAITNLESPLIDNAKPILKTGPNLKSPVKSLEVLKSAGFDLLTLANNHIMDFGEDGLFSTLQACSAAGIETVGAGKNIDETGNPFRREVRGVRIGIINITENEFSTTTNELPGAYPLNPIQNYYQIKETSQTVDHLIVIVHGGHEGYPLPSPRMKETYRFFIDAGATAVAGHHPHCYSGYEIYKGAPIFYSIGNFLFDKRNSADSRWDEGFMIEFSIDDKSMKFNIIPYIQNAETTGLKTLSNKESNLFTESLALLNEAIADDEELEKRFTEFCESSRNRYSAYIEPYSNRYLHALRNRNLFPSLLSDRKKRLLLNLTRCEAHRDVLSKIIAE